MGNFFQSNNVQEKLEIKHNASNNNECPTGAKYILEPQILDTPEPKTNQGCPMKGSKTNSEPENTEQRTCPSNYKNPNQYNVQNYYYFTSYCL